jgi:hypothetical protein
MSRPIDFDLRGFYTSTPDGHTVQLHTDMKSRVNSHYGMVNSEADYLEAQKTTKDDQPPKNANAVCCGFNIDLVSSVMSGILLLITLVYTGLYYNDRKVRLNQNMLLYAHKTSNMTTSMRQFRSTFQAYSGKDVVLEVPHWTDARDIVMMPVSVFSTEVNMFFFLIWVYFWSFYFQSLRVRKHDLYKPWRGPEFSRWLEYLFTSPCQAVLVSIAFGMGTADILIGHFGMQAAMVLFGYDIEQQVKKQFKYVLKIQRLKEWEQVSPVRMHHYPIRNVRLFAYLGVAWLLHLLIWGAPGSTAWGIGGQYYRTRELQDKVQSRSSGGEEVASMPWYVELIFWSQYISFTVFGLVCSLQVMSSLRKTFPTDKDVNNDLKEQVRELVMEGRNDLEYLLKDETTTSQLTTALRRVVTDFPDVDDHGRKVLLFEKQVQQNWLQYTRVYAILSITAKTFLEVGFLGLITVWKPWEDDAVLNRVS